MPNVLDVLIPRVMAGSLRVLRERVVMTRLVTTDMGTLPAAKGSTIDFSSPAAQTMADVTPGVTAPTPASKTPTQIQMVLDQWKYTDFHMTDSDATKVQADAVFIPKQVEKCMQTIASTVNAYIWSMAYKGVYSAVGTVGTIPFSSDSVAVATGARQKLAETLCPEGNRSVAISHLVEATALACAPFRDASQGGTASVVMEGVLGKRYGFDWYPDDQIPVHTAGTGSGYLVNNASGLAVGATTAAVDTGTGTLVVGDIITFAGHSQQYVISTAYAGGSGTIAFNPPLVATVADNAAITKVATHTVNLAFHKEAIVFASRPLAQAAYEQNLGQRSLTVRDPVTGLTIRLTVMRQWMQTAWAFDILYGAKLLYPEMACRIIH